MTHLYKLLIPDSSKNWTFILKNSANNLIFDSRSSNSIAILQFSDSASTRLRLQSFDIRLNNEPRVGTRFADIWKREIRTKFCLQTWTKWTRLEKTNFMHSATLFEIQWGSEYRTSLVFKWSKDVQSPNGLLFESHLNNRLKQFRLLSKYPLLIPCS